MPNLENKIVTHLTLYADSSAHNVPSYVYAKQYDTDSRYLVVRVKQASGNIGVSTASQLNATKPDGTHSYITGTANEDGTVTFRLTSNLLAVAGQVSCDISVFEGDDTSGDAMFTTSTFFIIVDESNYNSDAIESTDELSTIVVTPQMFGAKGDGVTDDTAAFKECFEHTNIYIPAGTYIISDTISVLKKTEIEGERYNNTYLKFTNELLFELNGDATIKDLNIVGNGTNNAVQFPYRDLQLYNVKFSDLQCGVVSNTEGFVAYNHIESCKFQNVDYPLYFPNLKGQFNTTIILGCEFTDYIYVLQSADGGRAINFDRCIFEGDGVAILNSNSLSAVMFSSCYFETTATLITDTLRRGKISVVNSWICGKTAFVSQSTNCENLYITFDSSAIINSAYKNGGETLDCLIDGTNIFAVDIINCMTAQTTGVPTQIMNSTVAENYGVATNCLIKFSQRATCIKLEYIAFRKSTTFGKEAQVSFDNTDNSLNLNFATNNFDGTLVPMVFADTIEELKAITNYYYAGGKMMFGVINDNSDLYVLRNKEWHKLELDVSVPTKTSELENDSGYLTLKTLPIYNGEVE